MGKKINYFLFIIFCITGYTVKAQIHNFINYNVGEGLEQSDILSVGQAENGYLLYGSNEGGIGYYDGYNFKSIKEKNGLSNNVVFSIVIDKQNNVWASTNSGVNTLSPNLNFVTKTYNEGTPFYSSYYSVEYDKLYFGSAKGLYIFNGDSLEKQITSNEVLNNAFVNSIYTDSKKNIWIGTRLNGLFRINSEEQVSQFSTVNKLPSNYVKTIIETKNKIWVGTLNGVAMIEKDSVSDFALPNNADGNITITSSTKYNGELVFGALNGHLYFINPIDNSYRVINEKNGFKYKKIWSLFTDKEDNLWFGTLGQGLTKFNSTFTYFNENNGLLNSYVNVIGTNGDEIWFGCKGNGINVVLDNKIIKTITSKELGTSTVNSIKKINSNIFIGRNGGVSIYKEGNFKNISFSAGIENEVFSIYESNDQIYLGTKQGLYTLKDDVIFKVKDTPSDFIFDIVKHNKKLYLASNKGYYVYDKNKFSFISEREDFNVGRVRSFVVDSKNKLWIGTNEGVFLKDKNTHIKIDEQTGLSSDIVYFLQLDNSNNLWIGTNKGVDRLKVDQYHKEGVVNIRNYSKSEGFIGVECNLNSSCLTKNNELWFGTINGAYLYNKDGDEVNTIAPKITLSNIKLNFNDVDWSNYTKEINDNTGLPKSLELNHTNNNFIFEYVGVSLKNPEKVFYQYKLEGLDDDWLPLTKDQKAVYTTLTPGDYTFILKAKNNDDVWVKEPVKFSFTIFPPWYETNWFYTSVVLLIVLAIYLFISIRTRNLKKTQQMLTQQVDERTSELREEKEKVEHINIELGEQKKVIEVANKNITDSINYAKKIQEAILPKSNKLDKYEDNLGVLYLPKDVVSGDFYWFDKLGDKLIIAAADCTGHGVPGAFMSMIGVNNLNQIILENKETNPSKILTQLNVAIKKVLRQEDIGSESKDGMDISICTFDTKNNTVQYAGAFRPLLYVRENELVEIKGSRNPIGGNAPSDYIYELNQIDIKKDDVFYMFSDGYPDQFGGAKGKKFMNKRLKQLFVEHHKKTPDEQREILKTEFYNWMGNEEQIDDILVMCMKF